MLLQNRNELRYSARKPLSKEQYPCLCQKTEDLSQKKCRKSAGNGPEIYKNQKKCLWTITRHGRYDERTDGGTGKWIDGWSGGWMVKRMDSQMDGRSDVLTDRRTEEQTDGPMNLL